MKKHLLLLVMVLLPMVASAEIVTIDGVSYDLTSDEGNNAELTNVPRDYSGEFIIPKSISYEGAVYSIISIGRRAFYRCTNITSITLPEGVTTIGEYAFENCSGLTSVTLPEGVTTIGARVFKNCSNITSVSFPSTISEANNISIENTPWYTNQPDGLIYIGGVAYKYKGTMPENTSITIKEGTITIGMSAFSGCTGLTSVTLPEGVTTIGEYAFSGCSNITSFSFPSSISEVGLGAVDGTPWYTNQPDGVVYIGSVAYKYKGTMPKNTSITIKDGTVSIGVSAFYGCSNLISISIPSSIKRSSAYAFGECNNLKSVTISDLYSWCNIDFDNNGSFEEYKYANPTYYSKHLYLNNIEVTKVDFPEDINNVGSLAFINCINLTSVVIPKNVKSIGMYSFENCRLEKLIVKNPNCSNGYVAFSDATCNHATLYVPIGSKWDMIYEKGWWPFINIREMADEKEELSDVKAYTLMNTKTMGYVVYDDVNDNTRSIQDIDENAANNSWQIIDANGNKCLYNIGAKKFASIKSDGNIALSEKPVALSMENGKDGIIIDNNSSSEWNFVLNEKINIDEHVTGIESITTSDSPTNVYYDLNGRKLDGVPTQKGVYIQNGKKVVIK